MIRELTINEMEEVSGGEDGGTPNCGNAAAAGGAVGLRYGLKGALAGAVIAGSFCLAGIYLA